MVLVISSLRRYCGRSPATLARSPSVCSSVAHAIILSVILMHADLYPHRKLSLGFDGHSSAGIAIISEIVSWT